MIAGRFEPRDQSRIDAGVDARTGNDLVEQLGADATCAPGELARTVRSATGSLVIGDQLTGGAPAVVDCVGSEATLTQALQVVAPGGTVHAVGMPATLVWIVKPCFWRMPVRYFEVSNSWYPS